MKMQHNPIIILCSPSYKKSHTSTDAWLVKAQIFKINLHYHVGIYYYQGFDCPQSN
jgi:hypothetical protein